MYYLKYDNENIFLTKHNKIILTQYNFYYKFMKNIININDKKSKPIEINGLIIDSKNTLIIDLTSISASLKIFSDDNRVIEEYIKVKLDNNIVNQEDEEKFNNIIKNILNNLYGNLQVTDIEIDIMKLIKSSSNIEIKNSDDFLNIFKEILKSNNLKNIFVIYRKSILDYFSLWELEDIQNEKLILFEICDKNSKFDYNDNILFFNDNVLQITYGQFIELIKSKLKIENVNNELYGYLINKIFFYSIDRKEVDVMNKYLKEVNEINKVLKNEFKIDLYDTLGYI